MAEVQVEYNFLSGNCGVKVSNLCLGTMLFADHSYYFPTDQLINYEDTCKMLDRYVELGGNFIDTANLYGDGGTEEFLGRWMSGKDRDNIVLATKCRLGNFKGAMASLSRKAIMYNIEESLKRLQTNFVDLYQIHCWDSGTPLEETLSTLNDLVRCGKVRYLGGSNLAGWQLQKIVDYNDKRGYNQFVSLQQLYNILDRTSENEAFEVCRNEGIGILPYTPLKGGLLTGKYKRTGGPVAGSRMDFASKTTLPANEVFPNQDKYKDNEYFWKIDDYLHTVAQNHGKTVSQVALRWLLQKPNVTSVIIGARNIQQMENNMGAGKGWKLTDDEMKTIDDLSGLDVGYPYREIAMFNGDRQRSGLPSGRQF